MYKAVQQKRLFTVSTMRFNEIYGTFLAERQCYKHKLKLIGQCYNLLIKTQGSYTTCSKLTFFYITL